MSLSLDSIENYQKMLKEYAKELPKIAENIVNRVSEEGLNDNYKSTIKKEIENTESKVTGGIKTTEEKDTYREFGTGVVGSESPHPDIMSGWIYDVNEHGEKGWFYPKGDGTYGWTKGQIAHRKFYNAMQRMEEKFPEIAKEEFSKVIQE